jgi:hypothetical protein
VDSVAPGGSATCSAPSGVTTAQTSFIRTVTTLSVDVGNTPAGNVGCASVAVAGVLATDVVIATPKTMVSGFEFVNAQALAGAVEVCLKNNGASPANPAAVLVAVMVLK